MSEPMNDERFNQICELDKAFRGEPSSVAWDDVRLYDDTARSMIEMINEVKRLRALVPPMPLKEALRITENVVMPKRLLRIAVARMAEDTEDDEIPALDEMRALLGEANDE